MAFTGVTNAHPVVNIIKHFTIVIYDSRVVIWGVFKSGTTLES